MVALILVCLASSRPWLSSHVLDVHKLLPTDMSSIIALGKPIWMTLPAESMASEWLEYRLGQRAEVFFL